MMPLVSNPQPRDGPVAITFEIEVDRMRGREFLRLMREVRLIHRRNGAFSWRLDEDLTRSNRRDRGHRGQHTKRTIEYVKPQIAR
jgi:hypothetical protein